MAGDAFNAGNPITSHRAQQLPGLQENGQDGLGIPGIKRARDDTADEWANKRLRPDDYLSGGNARSSTSTPQLAAQQAYNAASYAGQGTYGSSNYIGVEELDTPQNGMQAPQPGGPAFETPLSMYPSNASSYSGQSPSMAQSQNQTSTPQVSNPYSTTWELAEQGTGAGPYPPTTIQSGYSNAYGAGPMGAIASAYGAPFTTLDGGWSGSQYSYGAQPGAYNTHDPSILYNQDASLHLKLQSLSVLDNLSTQIIMKLAKGSLAETRKVYSRDTPFIDAIAIQLLSTPYQEIIRKANKAMFISSILEGHDISFFHLNEFFLEIFVPMGQRLLKWQGAIFLELKTQTYISALMNSDGPTEALLDELFPQDLQDRLISRHPDGPNLTPSETDFLERANARRKYLLAESATGNASKTLPMKYEWQDFLREFASAIGKNVENILNSPTRAPFGNTSQSYSQNGLLPPRQPNPSLPSSMQQPPIDTQTASAQSGQSSVPGAQSSWSDITKTQTPQAPGPSIAVTTQVDRARASPFVASQSTVSSPTSRGTGEKKAPRSGPVGGTPRQPWKQEEEDALLAGLTEVKGPHWSQILSLYGRGGSISEVLKDRNQIQLKDKARNLKLWYLKMGNDVPACLRGVTGELRKRGGARVRAALGLDGPDDGSPTGGTAAGAGPSASSKKSAVQNSGVRRVAAENGQREGSMPQIDPALGGDLGRSHDFKTV
ncbi:TTAGGG repeat binding factor [Zalaria obscura]|uniref:TTAGGG repeat binding factor n=1 Tax=Zalaria obscura TaxID=2024903 RepID=A0ACC3SDF9_9PEZI